MIEKSSIEQILDSVDIEDVAGKLDIALTKKYNSIVGCCPFHNEKTASFKINKAWNRYHCFGCGADGDAVDLVMKKRGCTYPEAIEWLADMYNIKLRYSNRELTPEEINEQQEKEKLYKVLECVQEFFVAVLMSASVEAENAKKYAFERWGADYCREIGIGYAPRNGNALLDWCREYNIDQSALVTAGILNLGKEQLAPYSHFRERVMIPIRDHRGRIISYTGRYIGSDPEIQNSQKYKNTRETPLFKKSKVVFGLNSARKGAMRSGRFIIVEGGPDVIKLQSDSIGLSETVAALGTAWSEEQFEQLRRYAKTLTFIPDADPIKVGETKGAGVKAVMKNGLTALRMGFTVTVREIPCGIEVERAQMDESEIEQAISEALKVKRVKAKKEYATRKELTDMTLDEKELADIPHTKEVGRKYFKNDPDSYITDASVFNSLDETLFPVWYGLHLFEDCLTELEFNQALNRICKEVLVHVTDEILLGSCIERLSEEYGRVKSWKQALIFARSELLELNSTENLPKDFSKAEVALLRELGIIVKKGCYVSYDKDGKLVRWSNFLFRPVLQIFDGEKSTRLFIMRNCAGDERMVEFRSSDFTSLRDFRKRIFDCGNFQWLCDASSSLTKITGYLFEAGISASRVKNMGWNKEEHFFAMANGLFYDENFYEANEMGVVSIDNKHYILPACSDLYRKSDSAYAFEKQFIVRGNSGVSMKQFCSKVIKVYGEGGMIALGWMWAAAFRDAIFEKLSFFPMLNLFGIKGSGKTGLAKVIASLFLKMNNNPPSCSSTSIPVIGYMLSHAINSVIVLDEFTNDLHPNRIDILKGIYDGRARSKINENGEPVFVQVNAAVILAGQYKPDDDAIFSRSIHLQYMKTIFTKEEDRNYNEMSDIEKEGNSHLLFELLKLRKVVERTFANAYNMCMTDVEEKIKGEQIESRIRKCWVIPLAVMRILEPYLDLPFSYTEMCEVVVQGMKSQNEQILRNSDTADFWKHLETLHSRGIVKEGCHFVIKELNNFKPLDRKISEKTFINPKRVIMLNFPALRSILEERFNRQTTGVSISVSTLESYLKAVPQYLGRKQQWFQNTRKDGEADIKIEGVGAYAQRMLKSKSVKAMCFDYDSLTEQIDFDLDTSLLLEHELSES